MTKGKDLNMANLVNPNPENNGEVGRSVLLKSEAFIPTMDEWWRLYISWAEKLESSFWWKGSKAECHDAVLDAFLKIMGIHPHLKLRKPLEPKSEDRWYGFVRHQVRGVMSNRRKHNDRASRFSTSDEDEVGVFGVTGYDFDSVCREDLRADIKKAIRKTCIGQGFSEKTIAGFFASKISCLAGKEVLKKVKGITSENALNVRNKSVLDRLKAVARDRSSELYRLGAA